MASGRFENNFDLWQIDQEDAWERTARMLAMIHNTTRQKIEDCKDPDEFNLWLKVEGVEGPDEENLRLEREIVAERRRKAKDGGQ